MTTIVIIGGDAAVGRSIADQPGAGRAAGPTHETKDMARPEAAAALAAVPVDDGPSAGAIADRNGLIDTGAVAVSEGRILWVGEDHALRFTSSRC